MTCNFSVKNPLSLMQQWVQMIKSQEGHSVL